MGRKRGKKGIARSGKRGEAGTVNAVSPVLGDSREKRRRENYPSVAERSVMLSRFELAYIIPVGLA